MPYSLALALSLLVPPASAVSSPSDSIRTDAAIRATVLRHASAVQKCYETEGLQRNPTLTGSVEITVTILPTGLVTDVGVSIEGFKGAGRDEVARCLAGVARNWKFDRGPYVTETIILPFDLVRDTPPPSKKGVLLGQRATG